MHRTLTAAVLATMLLATAVAQTSVAGDLAILTTETRAMLAKGQTRQAISRLEEGLPTVSDADRAGLLEALKSAYDQGIREADAAGRTGEADDYRENLAILSRRPRTADAVPAETPSTPPAPLTPAPRPVAEVVPIAEPSVSPSTLSTADAAFRAKNYAEAGRLYDQLAKQGELPPHRHNPWAYCRMAGIVHRINQGPKSEAEWASIRREIDAIRQLSPKNWYAEYLRNLASERTKEGRGTSRGGSSPEILRGASPDEPAPSPLPANLTPTVDGRSVPSAPRQGQPGAAIGNWKVWDTPNFRILHADDVLAEQVAGIAESARALQRQRWTETQDPASWSPRCDIYLYPTAAQFHQATGQDEASPGFSTMGMNAGRIIARRINLRADHPNLLPTILPHEITHVVLADLFSDQQIPRWADEGMAVLAEPASEQELRADDLDQPLATGRLFRLADLMVMDYPDGKFWSLYYAQSVSLTRYLVDQGSPAQFIDFVKSAQKSGIDSELRRIYKISGADELQTKWLAHVKQKSGAMAKTDAPADSAPVRIGTAPTRTAQ